jgi:inositol phosphorylceramide mannosyltransferase catalytic subunit
MIPKRIIQTGKSRQLPLLEEAAAANVRLINPDFEYLFFDDADVEAFVDTQFPQYRPLFDAFAYRIQKYDFFRYLAVYHYGGFYFDLDVFLARKLDELCALKCVFSFEELSTHAFLRESFGMDWEVGNYAFGASARHPFVGAIIENCVRAQKDRAWGAMMWRSIPRMFRDSSYVLATTGPGMVSRTLAEFPGVADLVTVLFPPDVCDQRHWHQFGNYGVHLQSGGWRDGKHALRRRLASLWLSRLRAAHLPQSRGKGPTRTLVFNGRT